MATSLRLRPLIEKYESAVIKNPEGCWDHRGKGEGYWRLSTGHTTYVYAHRWAYTAFIGPITEGLWVLHHCDNKRCTRPDHLYLGDHDQNCEDIRLRSTSRKAACRRGHPYTEESTYYHVRVSPKNGRTYTARQCRTCKRNGRASGNLV